MTNIDPVVDSDGNIDGNGDDPVTEETPTPIASPALPDEYTDSSRSSLSDEPAVAGHLETHWGF